MDIRKTVNGDLIRAVFLQPGDVFKIYSNQYDEYRVIYIDKDRLHYVYPHHSGSMPSLSKQWVLLIYKK